MAIPLCTQRSTPWSIPIPAHRHIYGSDGHGHGGGASHLRGQAYALKSKAGDEVPELQGKALGNATVHDLLRMASGAAEQNGDRTIWTPEQAKDWNRGPAQS